MKHRNSILDPICLLMKRPHTALELAELLDTTPNGVADWLKRLRKAGLIYIAGRSKGRGGQFFYAWQPLPFYNPYRPVKRR